MALTSERAQEIGDHLKVIVDNLNAITEEEFKEILRIESREEALGPLLNPTAFQRGGFDLTCQTRKVIEGLLQFKREVSGIGDFK